MGREPLGREVGMKRAGRGEAAAEGTLAPAIPLPLTLAWLTLPLLLLVVVTVEVTRLALRGLRVWVKAMGRRADRSRCRRW